MINAGRKWEIVLWSLIIIYSSAFSILSIERHYAFFSHEDTGLFSQVLWSTLHGKLFYTNLASTGYFRFIPHNYLAEHFSPILFLLIPFYAIWQETETLLIIQSAVLGLAALPLYMIVQERFKNQYISISFSIAWLISPYIWQSNISDFHLDTFEPLFIFSAFYFIYKKRILPYFIFVLLLLSCKEDTFFYAIAMGIFLVISMKQVKAGIYTIALSLLWGILTFNLFMPFFRGGIGGNYSYLALYSQFGGSFGEIFKTFLSKPQMIIFYLSQGPLLEIIFHLFLMLLFLPLFSLGGLILLLPSALQKLLANDPNISTLSWHYSSSVLPFFFIAAIAGLSNIMKPLRTERMRKVLFLFIGGLIIVLNIIMAVQFRFGLFGELNLNLPFPVISKEGLLWSNRRDSEIRKLLKSIPTNSSISTNQYIVSHVSKNFDIGIYPYQPLDKDIILLDIYGETYPSNLRDYKMDLLRILIGKKYGIVEYLDGFLYLKRGHDTSKNEAVAKDLYTIFEVNEMNFSDNVIEVFDPVASNKAAQYFDYKKYNKDGIIHGPYISLPPGSYEVSFRIKTRKRLDEDIMKADVSANSGKKILAERLIRGTDFMEERKYEEFRLKFRIEKIVKNVEFRLDIFGGEGIWVDRVRMIPEGNFDLKVMKNYL